MAWKSDRQRMLDLLSEQKPLRHKDFVQELIRLKIIKSEDDTGIIQRAIAQGYIIHFTKFNTLKQPSYMEWFELERLRHGISDIEEAVKRMESVKDSIFRISDTSNDINRAIQILESVKMDLLNKIRGICVR